MPTSHRLAVIPDVHMRRKMLNFAIDLQEEGYHLIFLGDYANKGPRGNDPIFLAELFAFAKTNRSILLIGNHDLAYLFPDREDFRIEGYEENNASLISDIYQEYKENFSFVYRKDKYLFSHAGLSKKLLKSIHRQHPTFSLNESIDYLNSEQPPELFYRTEQNGGIDHFDGPLWIRPEQFEGALMEEGITQVVGHSSQASIWLKYNLLMVDVQLPLIIEW